MQALYNAISVFYSFPLLIHNLTKGFSEDAHSLSYRTINNSPIILFLDK